MTDTHTPLTAEEKAAAEARFAEVAMTTDKAVEVMIETIFAASPNDEDAIMSGAMTAIVRFGIQRVQVHRPAEVLGVRDVIGAFIKHVNRAAEILLNRPGRKIDG